MALLNFNRFGITEADVSSFSYILGFDLGHGEISVSYWSLKGVVSHIPEDLNVNRNSDKKDFSALFLDHRGRYFTGQQAVLPASNGQLFSCFKVRPSRLDELYENTDKSKRELMQRLLIEVLKHVKQYNTGKSFEGRGLLVIGCPSSPEWLQADMDVRYAQVFDAVNAETGLNLVTVIMPESRASLVKVYKERATDANFVKVLHHGVIVYDFGSSTLDATSIDFTTNTQNDESIPLGASLIEELLLNEICRRYSCRRKDLLEPEMAKLDARRAKEAFYSSPAAKAMLTLEAKDDNILVQKLTPDFMRRITHELTVCYSTDSQPMVQGTWAGLCRKFLVLSRDNWLRKVKRNEFTGIILLTGGASRMDFIREIAAEVFPSATIICDGDPSFCVSRGLAWATNTDLQAAGLTKKAKDSIKKAVRGDMNQLREQIATSLEDVVYDYVEDCVKDWAEHGDNVTLAKMLADSTGKLHAKKGDDIAACVKSALDKYLNNAGEDGIKAIIVNTINNLFGTIFPGKINGQALGKFNISKEEWEESIREMGTMGDITFTNIVEHIDLESSIGRVLKNNILVIIGAIPFYFLAWLVDQIFDSDLADKLERSFSENGYKTLPRSKRQEIYRKMCSDKSKIKAQLHQSIKTSCISANDTTPSTEDKVVENITQNLDGIINKAIDNVSLYF